MFKLVRLVFSLACLAAFVWFATTVPLGKRTLLGHFHALWTSPAGRDLEDGVVEKTHETMTAVHDDLADRAAPASAPSVGRPSPSFVRPAPLSRLRGRAHPR